MSEITRVPHAPNFVEGILNLRGKIVVVINLLKRLEIKYIVKNVIEPTQKKVK